ncbi:6740_t:CDS:2 [Acaulospora morrowiae]|uniref:Actin-related protein 2/3 complex subunit 5 n=1 Tax=Acaulospora morrowiae TaxID=94023 RepID=A0A9N9B9A1_9GLOM|nr:6740_t:CDS:2 [Acaulospora morrowiae]
MSFRNIDIDILDEEQLVQEELFEFSEGKPIEPEEALSKVNTKGVEVRNLLTRGKTEDALATAIDNPPYGLNTTEAKDLNTKIVIEVLNSIKATDIPSLVKNLSSEQQDVLMKYIYRGMASPELYSSAMLLNWHEKLTEVAGVGCIVRVITDRKTV